MARLSEEHFTLWKIGSQSIPLAFAGGRIVSDAGLLAVRTLDKPLRVIARLAERLPDARSPKFIAHSVEALLTPEAYPILTGYSNSNDTHAVRDDLFFQILAAVTPDLEHSLASRLTLTRFPYASTRRRADVRLEELPVLLEMRGQRRSNPRPASAERLTDRQQPASP